MSWHLQALTVNAVLLVTLTESEPTLYTSVTECTYARVWEA